ncbi:g3377 [Coccomyxa elongata]
MDRTALGYSVRVGYQVKFTVRVQPGSETTTEIQYYTRQHSGHGPDAQTGPGLKHTFHQISAALRSRVQLKIRRGVLDADIVQQNRDEHADAFMAKHPNITSRLEASHQLTLSNPPRDYFLNPMDVANIRRALEQSDWMFIENPQQSIAMWAQQNHDDVLYLDLQRPIEGTSDHQFWTATQQGKLVAPTPVADPTPALDNDEPSSCAAQQGPGPSASQQESGSAAISTGSMALEPAAGPAAPIMEPAFNGADTNMEKPETINLDRVDGPQLAAPTATIKGGGKFSLYILVVVDDHKKAEPIAFLICSQERADLLQKFLEAVTAKVRKVKPDWMPSAVLVDACDAEIAAVRHAFDFKVAVFLCHWHVQKAWKK